MPNQQQVESLWYNSRDLCTFITTGMQSPSVFFLARWQSDLFHCVSRNIVFRVCGNTLCHCGKPPTLKNHVWRGPHSSWCALRRRSELHHEYSEKYSQLLRELLPDKQVPASIYFSGNSIDIAPQITPPATEADHPGQRESSTDHIHHTLEHPYTL